MKTNSKTVLAIDVGAHARDRMGKKKWRKHAVDVIERLRAALEPQEVLLGGGNSEHLDKLPKGCRLGDNADAFVGGFKMWANRTAYNRPIRKSA